MYPRSQNRDLGHPWILLRGGKAKARATAGPSTAQRKSALLRSGRQFCGRVRGKCKDRSRSFGSVEKHFAQDDKSLGWGAKGKSKDNRKDRSRSFGSVEKRFAQDNNSVGTPRCVAACGQRAFVLLVGAH